MFSASLKALDFPLKQYLLILWAFLIFSFLFSCFAEEFKSIKIELQPLCKENKAKIIYDSEINNNSYPFKIFCDSLNGWGRNGDCKKVNPLFVTKSLQPEGCYIIYVTTIQGKVKKYRLMNFKTMQDVQTGIYYETDFLQYLYEYIVNRYLEKL